MERQIQATVANFDGLALPRESVEVQSVQVLGDHAVAEVEVKTALKLIRKDGNWQIDEVRLGDRRWEKAEHILRILNQERTATTQEHLNLLVEGIEHYRRVQGRVPQVSDFEALVNHLTPYYMEPVVRIDAWSNPFSYEPLAPDQYDLRSAGPDGKLQTPDDVVRAER